MAGKALLPLFPLDLVLMPGEVLPLHIFEPRYRKMIAAARESGSEFGILRQTDQDLERVGCAAKVREVTQRFDDGRFNIRAVGTRRFAVRSFDASEECLHAVVEFFGDDAHAQADAAKVAALITVAETVQRLIGRGRASWDPNHPWLSFRISGDLPAASGIKQKLLELTSEVDRVDFLTGYLQGVVAKRDMRKRRERLIRGNGRLPHE